MIRVKSSCIVCPIVFVAARFLAALVLPAAALLMAQDNSASKRDSQDSTARIAPGIAELITAIPPPPGLAEAKRRYDEDARTNKIKLRTPLYTNAPCAEVNLRAAALAGDGLAAYNCDATNESERTFWRRLAATNGWVPAQLALAQELEHPLKTFLVFEVGYQEIAVPLPEDTSEERLPELRGFLASNVQPRTNYVRTEHRPGELVSSNSAAAAEWRVKAKAALPKLKADADKKDPRALYSLSCLYKGSELLGTNADLQLAYLKEAAESGLPFAELELGEHYKLATNLAQACIWYYRAATQGLSLAQRDLASLNGRPMFFQWDPDFVPQAREGAKWIFELASQLPGPNSYEGIVVLGRLYQRGSGVESNGVEAVRLFTRASEWNGISDGLAEHELALCYFGGEGAPQSDEQGVKWLRLGIARGTGYLEWDRGIALSYWVDGDYASAVKYSRAAAFQEDAQGQFLLCLMYSRGEGVEKDSQKAAEWYRRVVKQGEYGFGAMTHVIQETYNKLPEHAEEAFKLCRSSAEQGDAISQLTLGFIYQGAYGPAWHNNPEEAIRWWRRSAQQGCSLGQYFLGFDYRNGAHVPKDAVEAYKWLNLAAARGDNNAKRERDKLESEMTPSQIAEAQRLCREFHPRAETASSTGGEDSVPNRIGAKRPVGSGTGFFITPDGHLVTNAHVVEDGSSFKVLTATGLLPARLLKRDAANDLAVLKVEVRQAALPIAPSRTAKLGQSVATLGFPNIGLQGFSPKLARGEIASLAGAQDDARHFQISVPVQPGNSGGPLVDLRGNVVGVIVGKLSQSAALATSGSLAENVNYAIKSGFLLSFLESLPSVASQLPEPSTSETKFEDMVATVEKATVLVLVYKD